MKTLSLLFFASCFSFQIMGQGYLFDKTRSDTFKKLQKEEYGFAGVLPGKTSLRKFAPPTQRQSGQTCVGWSLSYATMSTIYNKVLKITDPLMKYFLAFDPNFLYSMSVENYTNDCNEGVYLPIAIEQTMKYGSKRILAPPALMKCSDKVDKLTDYFSAPFTPGSAYLVDLDEVPTAKEKIVVLKQILADGNPLPFGMMVTNSLMGIGSDKISATGLWSPKLGETELGGHAMCLIGYDDTRFGGAFEVMNSYGKSFGDQGFLWIKYADFIKYCKEVYLIEAKTLNSGKCKIGDCDIAYSHLRFDDGAFYEGDFNTGKPDGYGLFVWPDNTMYSGMWENGNRHGKGLLIEKDKIYGCTYKNDELIEAEELGFAEAENKQLNAIKTGLIQNGYQISELPNGEIKERLKSLKHEF